MATILGNSGDNVLAGTNGSDNVFGGAGNDTLFGGPGDDTLYGGGGDDLLSGGAGTDLLDGGAGLDIADYSSNAGPILVNFMTAPGASFPGTTWPAERFISIEGVILGSGNDTAVGNAEANRLSGRAGNNSLSGGDGDDWLDGGTGQDVLDGGAGVDTLNYRWATTRLAVSFAEGAVRFVGVEGQNDVFSGIEVFHSGSGDDMILGATGATAAAITVLGGAGSDTIAGTTGDDYLAGKSFADALFGGGGNDTLWGGAGTDTLHGGAGLDVALYHEVSTGIRANLGTKIVSFPGRNFPSETLIAIEGIEAGSGNDTLIGGSAENILGGGAGNDILQGQAGNDTLDGGTGNDSIDGGTGIDTVSYASHAVGMTIDLAAQRAYLPGNAAYTDRLVSIEHATGGFGDDRLLGTGRGETLDGGAGGDTLAGGGGDDYLYGGNGDDIVLGGAGNDTISGGTTNFGTASEDGREGEVARLFGWLADDGTDTLDGGAGSDTLEIQSLAYVRFLEGPVGLLGAAINLTAGTLRLDVPNASVDVLVSIENVVTHGGNDLVVGGAEANLISVGGGINTVFAGGGNDTIFGGAFTGDYGEFEGPYTEQLEGGAGDDVIFGSGNLSDNYWLEPGTDLLDGGAGNDTIEGGAGGADMIGGEGADTFVFTNEVYYYNDPFDALPTGGTGTIADFDPTAGDAISILIVEDLNAGTPTFLGEVESLDDLEDFEFGYVRSGNDTIVRFTSDHQDSAGDPATESLNITLSGYTGELDEGDFLFTWLL